MQLPKRFGRLPLPTYRRLRQALTIRAATRIIAPTYPVWTRSDRSAIHAPALGASLTPSQQPPRASDFSAGDRDVPLRLGHLLANVGTIPDSAQHVSDPYDRQLLLENAGYDAAQAEWYDLTKAQAEQGIPNDPSLNSRHLQGWMWEWHQALVQRFEDLSTEVSQMENSDREGAHAFQSQRRSLMGISRCS